VFQIWSSKVFHWMIFIIGIYDIDQFATLKPPNRMRAEDISLKLQAIIETAIDGIITIDSRGRIESFNNAARAIFGYEDIEVIGHNVKMLMPEPDKSAHDEYLARYQRTKEPRIIGIGREVVGKRKDNTTFPLRLAVGEVLLNDRVIYTGIIHDLSEVNETKEALKQANLELEEKVEIRTNDLEVTVNKLLDTNSKLEESQENLMLALAKEKELNELKSRFVSMASHEFRTPLSTVMSSASLISRYEAGDQQDKRVKHVDRIKSAVNNLTGILNDFLSLSKLEEGYIELVKESFDLSQLCHEVQKELEGLLRGKQTIVHSSTGETYLINNDKRILKNIFFNLISNAVKYSHEDSVISCSIEYASKYILIHIKDDGIGIPAEDQKYLFSRFFRARNADNIQGTGLGLHIVQQYLKLLGGTISFISEENKGSTFTVRLDNIGN